MVMFSQKKNEMEIARVIAKRYNCKAMPNRVLTPFIMKEIDQLLDHHFQIYMDPVFLSDGEIDQIFDDFMRDARVKSYDKRFQGEGWDYREDISSLRFSLKDADKVANMTKGYNPGAVAQGIAASSLGKNAKMHLITRIMASVRRRSHKKTSMVYGTTMHGQSLEAFINEIYEATDKIAFTKPSIINSDLGQADSGHTECTVYLKNGYWKRLGFSTEVLDYVRAASTNSTIVSQGISATTKNELTSGELLTKEDNEVQQEVIGNFVLEGSGPLVWGGSGDDFNKIQGGLHVNERRLGWVATWANFKIVLTKDECVDFCGMLFDSDGVGLNLAMKTLRVLSRHSKDDDDLAEYQTSLKEYIHLVQKIGVNKCIEMTRRNYSSWIDCMSYTEATACYEFLVAYAFCDTKEVSKQMVLKKYEMPHQDNQTDLIVGGEVALNPADIVYREMI